MVTPGTVIILNGASSSGKTSIVRALQEVLDEPYLDSGLDRFLWTLPKRYMERSLWDEVLGLAVEAGPVGHRLVFGMHRALVALVAAGNNVIVDHVLVEPAWLRDCATVFNGARAFLVGERCPLEVLEQRERERRDRTLGQARAQHRLVHADAIYDIEVDTSVDSAEACALQIKEWLRGGGSARALKHLFENSP